jgi:hypothetical protein
MKRRYTTLAVVAGLFLWNYVQNEDTLNEPTYKLSTKKEKPKVTNTSIEYIQPSLEETVEDKGVNNAENDLEAPLRPKIELYRRDCRLEDTGVDEEQRIQEVIVYCVIEEDPAFRYVIPVVAEDIFCVCTRTNWVCKLDETYGHIIIENSDMCYGLHELHEDFYDSGGSSQKFQEPCSDDDVVDQGLVEGDLIINNEQSDSGFFLDSQDSGLSDTAVPTYDSH